VYSSDKGSTPVDLYIGANEECTAEKLKEINYRFGQDWRDFWHWYHSPARKELKSKGVQIEEMYTEDSQLSQTRDETEELRARLTELEVELTGATNKIEGLERESRELRYRCSDLERENARLERLGTDYSHASFQVLQAKYQKALDNAKHWEEAAGSYRRQAEAIAKKREEAEALIEQLEASAGPRLNQSNPAAILNRLRKERKNSKADLKDIELILELIEAITL
jgi:DNA repair exonuclease SbcCD ATPase subunit